MRDGGNATCATRAAHQVPHRRLAPPQAIPQTARKGRLNFLYPTITVLNQHKHLPLARQFKAFELILNHLRPYTFARILIEKIMAIQPESPVAGNLLQNHQRYPFQVDWLSARAWMLEVNEDWYRHAAFLDQRALSPSLKGQWMALDDIQLAIRPFPERAVGLIFHIGHCGSTLISRALGLSTDCFSLREPLPLRDLANFTAEIAAPWSPMSAANLADRIDLFRRLWARTPRQDMLAIVKTTSFTSLMAGNWLKRYQNDHGILLSMAPEIYITTVLGASSYVADLIGGAKARMSGLIQSTSATLQPLHSMSPGEVAAMTFAAEMVQLHMAKEAAGKRALQIDFDTYLNNPISILKTIFLHFGKPVSDAEINGILRDPIMTRYSKATDYAFSGEERRERLAQSCHANRSEITKGINWMRSFAHTHPLVGKAIANFGYNL